MLNWACNHVLQRLEEGLALEAAVREAQDRGYAEADPTRDMSGRDSASKLAMLLRTPFGIRLDPETIPCQGIQGVKGKTIRELRREGRILRLVASGDRTAVGLKVRIRPLFLPGSHPLAGASGVENRFLIDYQDGTLQMLSG